MHASHARDWAKGISFNQCGNHLLPFVGAQFVHVFNMLDRSSIVKQKDSIGENGRISFYRTTLSSGWKLKSEINSSSRMARSNASWLEVYPKSCKCMSTNSRNRD